MMSETAIKDLTARLETVENMSGVTKKVLFKQPDILALLRKYHLGNRRLDLFMLHLPAAEIEVLANAIERTLAEQRTRTLQKHENRSAAGILRKKLLAANTPHNLPRTRVTLCAEMHQVSCALYYVSSRGLQFNLIVQTSCACTTSLCPFAVLRRSMHLKLQLRQHVDPDTGFLGLAAYNETPVTDTLHSLFNGELLNAAGCPYHVSLTITECGPGGW